MKYRQIRQMIPAMPTSDGAGVKLKRSLGQNQGARLDPFLMLDEFFSDNPNDYLAGFPNHPHRGFETVTYMLEGHMLHEDHLGNQGHLRDGGAQWMTAGHGVIHSEMPQQKNGRMRGFQLWINLPAVEKMRPADYCDVQAEQIPRLPLDNGGEVVAIAGTASVDGKPVIGYYNGLDGKRFSTNPIYLDLRLPADTVARIELPIESNAFVYVYEGQAVVGSHRIRDGHAALLGEGDAVQLDAGNEGVRLLLLAARPIGEPVVQYGPFVMNSTEEIEQALRDYRDGNLTNPGARSRG